MSRFALLGPKPATGPGWRFIGVFDLPDSRANGWMHDTDLLVLSSVDVAERDYHGSGVHVPHFHVSATSRPVAGRARTCTDQEMEVVRGAFGMGGAEEDNHGKGLARHLWIACDREKEPACPCKKDQDRTVEGDRVRHEDPAEIAKP